MTSKTIFNMDSKLKKAAMKKARDEGTTLTAVLNMATRSYVEDRLRLEYIRENIRQGREAVRLGQTYSIQDIAKKYNRKKR